MLKLLFILSIILFFPPNYLLANKIIRPPQKFFSTSIGGGLALSQNIRKNNLTKIFGKSYQNKKVTYLPIPIVSMKIGRFRTSAMGLTFDAYQSPLWGVDLLLMYTGDKYKADLMQSRKKSVFLGINGRFHIIECSYIRDVQSISHGGIFTISSSPRIALTKKIHLNVKTGIRFYSKNYVDYYFGVKDHKVIIGDRDSYSGKSSTAFFINPGMMYFFSPTFMLMAGVGIDFYSNGIYSSPTVTRKTKLSGMLGLIYKI